MAKQIKAGVIGAAGYTGGELLRLLRHHPQASIAFIHSNSQAGKPVQVVHAAEEPDDDEDGEEHRSDDREVAVRVRAERPEEERDQQQRVVGDVDHGGEGQCVPGDPPDDEETVAGAPQRFEVTNVEADSTANPEIRPGRGV